MNDRDLLNKNNFKGVIMLEWVLLWPLHNYACEAVQNFVEFYLFFHYFVA